MKLLTALAAAIAVVLLAACHTTSGPSPVFDLGYPADTANPAPDAPPDLPPDEV